MLEDLIDPINAGRQSELVNVLKLERLKINIDIDSKYTRVNTIGLKT